MLEKIERIEKPTEIKADMNISLSPSTVSGNDVLCVKGLSKAFGKNLLFSDLDFEIKRGERVAIIGNNGISPVKRKAANTLRTAVLSRSG